MIANKRTANSLFVLLLSAMFIISMYILRIGIRNLEIAEFDILLKILGFVCISVLMVAIKYWKSVQSTLINPFNMFLISFMLFTQGQVILNSLGFNNFNGFNIFKYFSSEDIVIATIYSLICYTAFFMGSILMNNNRSRKKIEVSKYDPDVLTVSIKSVGKLLFIIFIVPFLIHQYITINTALKVGYKALNDYSNYNSIFFLKVLLYCTEYFKVSIILLLIGNKNNKKTFNFILYLFLIYPFTLLLIGERTESTAMIVLLFFLKNRYFNKKNQKIDFRLVLVGLILIIAYPAIMSTRNNGIVSIGVIMESVKTTGIIGTVVDSIANLGYSIFPLIQVMKLVPSIQPYRYGLTYIAAITAVIPFLKVARKNSALGEWLMNTLGMSYGPGFSMPAEAYINFGWWMPIGIMMLMGFLISKVLVVSRDKNNEGIYIVLTSIFYLMNITLPRREILGAIRDIAYYMILIYFVIKIKYSKIYFKNYRVRVKNNEE